MMTLKWLHFIEKRKSIIQFMMDRLGYWGEITVEEMFMNSFKRIKGQYRYDPKKDLATELKKID